MKIIPILSCSTLLFLFACGGPKDSTSASTSSNSSSSSSSASSSSSSSGEIQEDSNFVYAINSGGSVTTLNNIQYHADRFYNGGTVGSSTGSIDDVNENALYQSERYGNYKYEIPVTNSSYSVKLNFAELYQQTSGARQFSVSIEGEPIAQNLDLYAQVGGNTAYEIIVPMVLVADGSLTIELSAQIDNATISGFSIYSSTGGQYIEPPTPSICPSTGPCNILPLGDSITDGVGGEGGAYRVELFRQAMQNNKDITFSGSYQNGPTNIAGAVFPRSHEGHSGWSINQIADIIPSPALNSNPHIILLLIGTNDVWVEPDNDDPQAMAQKLGTLIDKITANLPDTLLAVGLITPRNDYARDFARAYNDVIPKVVQQRKNQGANIILVDQYNTFPSNGLASDNLHPNDVGYTSMGKVWYTAIAPYLR